MFDNVQSDLSEAVNNITDSASGLEDKKDLRQSLDKVQLFLVLATIFGTPFFFLPLGIDWFDLPKTLFFAVMVGLSIIVGIVRLAVDPKFKLTGTRIDKNLVLIVVSVIISAALSVNRVNSLTAEPTTFFLLAVFFFISVNTLTKLDRWKMAFNLIIWSGAVLGLIQFLQVALVLTSRMITPLQNLIVKVPWLVNILPANNSYTLVLLLALLIPLAGAHYLSEKKDWSWTKLVPAVLIVLGFVSASWILFNQRPILLDADTGRRVAMGVIGKSYQNALFGVGPGEYAGAFSQFKSIDFNATPYWNLNFTSANSFAFYVLSIGGLVLFFAFGSLLLPVYKMARERLKPDVAGTVERSIFVSLGLALIGIILLPLPFLALFGIFVLLSMLFSWYGLDRVSGQTFDRQWGKSLKFLALGCLLVLAGSAVFGQGKLFLADLSYRQSLEAAAKNQGVNTYNGQVQTAQMAPWKDAYRVQLARTNLALADSLASQPNLTDQQKQTVVQLVQQSLAEGRNAVSLEPNFAGNWANLALIYRNLINFAQGADQWAVTTESQAVALDPMNPQYRLDLGGIYFAAKDYQAAAQQFAAAVQLKPDLANSHYNLAQALKLLNINDQAGQQLQLVAQLVCVSTNPNKSDCDKVNSEIKDLAAKISPPQVAGAATPATIPAVNQTLNNSSQSAAPNLPKAKTQPPVHVASPSGELAQ